MKLGIIFLIFFSGCTKNLKLEKGLSLSLPADISTLDTANCFDTVCYPPLMLVYETLFEIEYLKRPYTLRPLLAENFPTISEDRLTYTFRLKKGIRYHKSNFLPEGREVKSQDFHNQIKRLAFLGTRSQGFWLVDQKIKGINEWRNKVGTDLNLFFKEPIPGISTPDDHTLIIKLNRPYPQLLWALSMAFTSPIPEEAIKGTTNDLRQTFFGTGPYQIKEFNPSQGVTLLKNDHYRSSVYPNEGDQFALDHGLLKDSGAKLPFVNTVRFTIMKEGQTEWLNFMAKKIDFINLVKDQYPLALNQDGKLKEELIKSHVKLQVSPTSSYWWLAFNMKDSIVGSNLNLRKAISHGINIEKYIELFTYNAAQKANSIYPPSVKGYSPEVKLPYGYNLELAKDFLKKAGYPEGRGLPVLTYDVRGTDTRKRQMGEFIQQELKKIGINVQVRLNTFPSFLEKSRNGELQFWQGGWVLDYPDSENVLQLLTSNNLPPGPNSSQYSNPEFDKLFNQLREMEDNKQKFELMRKMEEIVNRDLPWSMQYYSNNYILHHEYVHNFRYSDIIYNSVKYLRIEKEIP
jgi:oligopeptide transport system substrate-binding protein